jgi:hypothetical protein
MILALGTIKNAFGFAGLSLVVDDEIVPILVNL